MIDEGLLEELLARRAEGIPVPDSAVAALLEDARTSEHRALRSTLARPSLRVLAAAAAVIAVVVGGVALTHRTSESTVSKTAARTAPKRATQTGTQRPGLIPPRAGVPSNGTGAAPTAAGTDSIVPYNGGLQYSTVGGKAAVDAPADAQGGAAHRTASSPNDSARIVKTGAIELRVVRHTFGTAVGRATTIAAAEGGFVSDASTDESAAVPSGHLTIRVPAARFNDTVHRLRALGTVLTASTRGVDATGKYTDLRARLNAANATRTAYLSVLAKATTIGDILAVQDRIQGVQTQIEQLQGQINDLDNRTTYATVTLAMAEPGPKPKVMATPHRRSGVAIAWDNARNGFTRRVEGIISHSGSVAVITIALLLLAFALRLLVPRARRLFV